MSKTILVVEDIKTDAELLNDLLRLKGYDIKIVNRGTDALEFVQKSPPDLILMDIQLPKMDGYEVTKKLKGDPKTKNIPIIAITAYALHWDRDKCLDAGCDEYMSKPIKTRELPRLIEQFIGPEDN